MKPPRFILFDDNVRGIGGHYFELMSVLATEAQTQGWTPVAVTHRDLPTDQRPEGCETVHRVFRTHRLLDASLGVDGRGGVPRDANGRPVDRDRWARRRLRAAVTRRERRPDTMFATYRQDVRDALTLLNLGPGDRCVFQTGDDFSLLALLAALRDMDGHFDQGCSVQVPQRVDVIVHFALVERSTRQPGKVLRDIGRQLTPPILRSGIDLRIHATTPRLAQQWKRTGIPAIIDEIHYPVRQTAVGRTRTDDIDAAGNVRHLVMAGMPRAEKGRRGIAPLLQSLTPDLEAGRLRLSMQASQRVARRVLPRSLRTLARVHCSENMPDLLDPAWRGVRFIDGHLSADDYARWLSASDLAVFLYEPDRYEARASGVLLEMMIRGVPVVVPDHCYLSDVVRKRIADPSHRLIYRDRSQLIDAIRRFASHRHTLTAAAGRAAAGIRMAHHARNVFDRLQLHCHDKPLAPRAA